MIKGVPQTPQVLFLVERGWRGSREIALSLARQHIHCRMLIKGKVPADVLEIITPRAGVSISSHPRWYCKLVFVFIIFQTRFAGRLRCVIVNKERTLRWLRLLAHLLKFEVVLLNERNEEIELSNDQRRAIRPEELAGFLRSEDRNFL